MYQFWWRGWDSFGARLQLTVDPRMLIPHKMLTGRVLIAVLVLRLASSATIVTRGQDTRTRRGAGDGRAMVRHRDICSPCLFKLKAFYNDHCILGNNLVHRQPNI